MPRYFVLPKDIVQNTITIKDEDAKHLITVLRAKIGEVVEVCDGLGQDYFCVVKEIGKKDVILKIEKKAPCKSEPKTKITLFQGLPKADKMEFIIQKCVELGVDKIVPVATERAVVKLDKKDGGKKVDRWQKIAESAAKQCGRGIIPQIGEVVSFKEAIAEAKKYDSSIIPYEKEEKIGLHQVVENFKGANMCVFIGPEGGFDEKEIAIAMENNVLPITLGKRILRTETAAMAMVAILLHELG